MTVVWVFIILIVAVICFYAGAMALAFVMRSKIEHAGVEMEKYLNEIERQKTTDYVLGACDTIIKYTELITKATKEK
jgi:flagellar basal body-associated protein FliL